MPSRFITRLGLGLLLLSATLTSVDIAAADEAPAVTASPSAADVKAMEEALPAHLRSAWQREWGLYASRYVLYEGEYFACAEYQQGFPSSLGKTANQIVEQYSQSQSVRLGQTMVKDITIRPSLADAHVAAVALPSMTSGSFGRAHSVQIVQILGPRDMIVRDVWLIDADELDQEIARLKDRARNRQQQQEIEHQYRFRQELAKLQRSEDGFTGKGIQLLGYDTQHLRPAQRWRGPDGQGIDLAIAGTRTIMYQRNEKGRPRELEVTVALPVQQFRSRITREQFVQMLATRGFTLESFMELTARMKKEDTRTAVPATIRELERHRPKPTASDENETEKGRRSDRTDAATTPAGQTKDNRKDQEKDTAEKDAAKQDSDEKGAAVKDDASDQTQADREQRKAEREQRQKEREEDRKKRAEEREARKAEREKK